MKNLRVLLFALLVLSFAVPASARGLQPVSVVERCKEDLAEVLKVGAGDIQLKSVEDETWPDGSLGYPTQGGFYTQAVMEGYRIVLVYGGKEYEYHTGSYRQRYDPSFDDEQAIRLNPAEWPAR